jgi:hypothetical protein
MIVARDGRQGQRPMSAPPSRSNWRFDAVAEFAGLAASYWTSFRLAADRGERLWIEVHRRQLVAVTREAFGVVKTLVADPDARGTA